MYEGGSSSYVSKLSSESRTSKGLSSSCAIAHQHTICVFLGDGLPTCGTLSLSAWDAAASVVTVRRANGAQALRLRGAAALRLKALESILDAEEKKDEEREDEREAREEVAERVSFGAGVELRKFNVQPCRRTIFGHPTLRATGQPEPLKKETSFSTIAFSENAQLHHCNCHS